MKIVAFLLSPSDAVFSNQPAHVLDKYRDDQVYHRKMLRQSMTGNRLYQAFGDLYEMIWWDNVIPVGGTEPDAKHVNKVIMEQKPDLILTFGKAAETTIEDSIAAINRMTMSCHHPNARFKTQSDLDLFAMKVRGLLREWTIMHTK